MASSEISITPSDPDHDLKRENFTYLLAKPFEIASSLRDDLSLFGPFISVDNSFIAGSDSLNHKIMCGRIMKEPCRLKLDEESILFYPYNSEKRYHLNLKNVKDYSFFSGQSIVLRGAVTDFREITVHQVLNDSLPLLPLPENDLTFDGSLKMCIVSGPFPEDITSDNGLVNKLSSNLIACQPDVIILIGPFVDESEPEVHFRRDIHNYVDNLVEHLQKVCPDAHYIIVPSTLDLINERVMPSPPIKLSSSDSESQRIHSMPNPCFVNVNGIHLAITSCDVIMHLVREEFNKSSTQKEGRMSRLCQHLIRQRTLYPIFPPAENACVDFTHYKYLQMPVRPHLMIVPSVLKGFILPELDVTCVNSESIRKGIFVTVEIDKSKLPEDATSLTSAINVQLCKLE